MPKNVAKTKKKAVKDKKDDQEQSKRKLYKERKAKNNAAYRQRQKVKLQEAERVLKEAVPGPVPGPVT